jgi:hypothetical protein
LGWTVTSSSTLSLLRTAVLFLAGASLVTFVSRLALMNHRSAERGAKRVWVQTIQIAAFATIAAIVVVSVVGGLYAASTQQFRMRMPPPIHQSVPRS